MIFSIWGKQCSFQKLHFIQILANCEQIDPRMQYYTYIIVGVNHYAYIILCISVRKYIYVIPPVT